MPLYARSDLMSVSIPANSGGCGSTHSRPVKQGAVQKVWELRCPPCESYLRGDRRPRVIKVTGGDKNKGIPSRMEHVADADPHWASSPEAVPKTPDEENIHTIRAVQGAEQLKMLEAFAAATAAGLDIPKEAWWLLEQNFDPRILKGRLECANGHDNAAGTKFCGECGISMNAKAAIPQKTAETAGEDEPVPDLQRLHVATLRKMCRERGVPDRGSKTELISRLG